jgi:hypothetical protein
MSSKALKRGKRENMVKSREKSEISQGEMRDCLIIFKGQIASNAGGSKALPAHPCGNGDLRAK